MSEGGQQEGNGQDRQLFCRLITPEEVVYDGEADRVICRIADGDIGVMRDHAPVVSAVEIGAVRITQDDERHVYATSDGFFKVADNLVQILVEEAVAAEEIDADAAESRYEQADNELSEVPEDEEDGGNDRQRREIERRRDIAENLTKVAREYGNQG